MDGAVDMHGNPAVRDRTGNWAAGILILVNQGLATLAFFGVGVNLGLVALSLSSYIFLLKPKGCGDEKFPCESHSSYHTAIFYVSIYLIALGNGGYQPNIATFGADQFDEGDPNEGHSKIAFFSFFYLALNLGSLFSNTILGYFEDSGLWTLGFWASAGSAAMAFVLFICGTPKYRFIKPGGNPLPRFCQVFVAAIRKWKVKVVEPEDYLFKGEECSTNCGRKLLHTEGFSFLDKAAYMTPKDVKEMEENRFNPWHVSSVTQVEEVKCILRLLPIWLCTILYSVVFTQMASLFVEQGAAMKTTISTFHIPPASMSSFDILSVAVFIFFYRRVLDPFVARKTNSKGLTELQRMGIGLILAIMAMISAGLVEHFRLKYAAGKGCNNCDDEEGSSSLSIFWQVPQYALIGASEVFMYVGQLEFFNGQAPDGLKSFGSALCMTSISLGNYVSSLIVAIVMKISVKDQDMPGWIPGNLNKGHLDRFYFLLAVLTSADFLIYITWARWYKYIKFQGNNDEEEEGINKVKDFDLKL
ncbi:hypothetical protein PIB30_009598 [Stylosanthes scabra]|uniref:Uncharacterized protein n=1 Tax=Stylosanthes scabra TaxID=79078 RepID=A0ABU6R464_9FABA|nr:hypothetical protein [Stylosanthes scabra]